MNKELYKKHGVTVSLVGASLVFGTVFGQCTMQPNLPMLEEVEIEAPEAVIEPTEEPTAAPVEEPIEE
tara:strand:- start:9901 stop:10104 length:204 start_codon:yes stop_codon:yes gene_type:complete